MIPQYCCILFLVVSANIAIPSPAQPAVGLLPDLAFHFTCKDVAADSLASDLGRMRLTLEAPSETFWVFTIL